jgi:hypothetical protein
MVMGGQIKFQSSDADVGVFINIDPPQRTSQQYRPNLPNILLTHTRSVVSKVDELETILRTNNIDIGALTETWINTSVPPDLIEITDYVCYGKDRNDGRRGGGVCCYIRTDLLQERLNQLDPADVESIWLLYRSKRMPRKISHLAIGIYYHTPGADSRRTVQHIVESADFITRTHPYSGVIITDDFNNLPEANILSYPLKQIVHGATRKTEILDKIFTNVGEFYQQPAILPPIGSSDHNCVLLLSYNSDATNLADR